MKHLTIAISIFLLTLISGNISFANQSTSCKTATRESMTESKTLMPAEDTYTYVRVCIDGKWWTYVYLDGSFVVAIPDADE